MTIGNLKFKIKRFITLNTRGPRQMSLDIITEWMNASNGDFNDARYLQHNNITYRLDITYNGVSTKYAFYRQSHRVFRFTYIDGEIRVNCQRNEFSLLYKMWKELV